MLRSSFQTPLLPTEPKKICCYSASESLKKPGSQSTISCETLACQRKTQNPLRHFFCALSPSLLFCFYSSRLLIAVAPVKIKATPQHCLRRFNFSHCSCSHGYMQFNLQENCNIIWGLLRHNTVSKRKHTPAWSCISILSFQSSIDRDS